MQSLDIKNWITALVVGILGLLLAAFGVVLAYKQLKRTKRPDDIEVAQPKSIVPREVAVGIELTENPRMTSVSPATTRDGMRDDTDGFAVDGGSPEMPLSATNEGG